MSEPDNERKEKYSTKITGPLAVLFVALAFIGFIVVVAVPLGVGARLIKDTWYPDTPPNLTQVLFGCNDTEHCVIKSNSGGEGIDFLKAAWSLGDSDFVSIDGKCLSACSMFADYARPHVCVTEKAVMAFHVGSAQDRENGNLYGYILPAYAKDITLWVYAHGDFPNTEKGEPFLGMGYPETLKFWLLCPTEEVAKKGDRLDIDKKKVAPAKK